MMWHWRLIKTTSCSEDLSLFWVKGNAVYACVTSSTSRLVFGVRLDTYRCTWWNPPFINSRDIVWDNESTNGKWKGGNAMELWARIFRWLPIHTSTKRFPSLLLNEQSVSAQKLNWSKPNVQSYDCQIYFNLFHVLMSISGSWCS